MSPAPAAGKASGLTLVRLLAGLAIATAMRFWGLCSTGMLILFLMYWFYGGYITFLLLIVAILGMLYNLQDKLLYFPEQPAQARLYVESPSTYGLPYEIANETTKDGVQINLVFIRQPSSSLGKVPTVVFLHGNAGNVGHRLINAHAMYMYSGVNILLVEYRGYGKSRGSPSEHGFYLDAQAGMDYLLQRPDIDHNQIVVFGRSLGGAVAIQLATIPAYARHMMCLVVENTFTSIPGIATQLFDFVVLKWLPVWCYKNKYPSLDRIQKLRIPMLFLSGQADTLIPPHMMQQLYELSGSGLKRMALFADGTHNETWQCAGYYEAINKYLQEARAAREGSVYNNSAATFISESPFDDHGLHTV